MARHFTRRWLMVAAFASVQALSGCGNGTPGFVRDEHHLGSEAEPSIRFSASTRVGEAVVRVDQFTIAKRLAITHSYTLRLASAEVEAVQASHLAECARLGCTVLATGLDRSIEGRLTARSSVRIAPDAFATFVAVISAAPAQVVSHSETAEDKTIAMLDVEKRLEVKSVLRDRLAALLKDPAAKSAADLAAIEKELAQVQGDIEASVAQRDYLRTITETLRVDIHYNALGTGVDLFPISRAVNNMGRTVVESVAVLISFIAAMVPWLPVIALLAWAIRRGLRRRRSALAASR